jgi:hypothetical protein
MVGRTVKRLGAQCVVLADSQGAPHFEEVERDGPFGFDLATTPWIGSLPPLKFIADGHTYTIEKADLLEQVQSVPPFLLLVYFIR